MPGELSSFVGRERELSEVGRLLGDARLLTLTGAGGSGKTRLALRAASAAVGFEDGVFWVELASLSDETLVPREVARTLGVREAPGRSPVETLAEHVGDGKVLLVLDNCEHLLDVCARLADALLRSCPWLKILATSREPLGVRGEVLWQVPPLSLPDESARPSREDLLRHDSVRLFVERAGLVAPGFALSDRDAGEVSKLCQRLDGMPLALELAAARVKVLSVRQILERLDDRFGLLTSSGRMVEPRQRTLRATIDWSHDLLSRREKVLFRRLSVFSGGFTLEASERICAGEDVEPEAVLDLLSRLVDQSLVVSETAGTPHHATSLRYRLLETVRRYGWEMLEEAGEEAVVRERHAGFFLVLAETAEPELRGEEQQRWLERLEVEHDNLRSALAWGEISPDNAEMMLRLAGALWWFWWLHGYFAEGRTWLERALARGGGGSTLGRAKALHGAGWLARHQGEYGRAESLLDESLGLYRALGEVWGESVVLHRLGAVARDRGDMPRATALLERSLSLARQTGDGWATGAALYWMGLAAHYGGENDRAAALLEEVLTMFHEHGDRWARGRTLGFLGGVTRDRGHLERSEALLQEALATGREVGDRWGVASWLYQLARLRLRQENEADATALFSDSLLLFRELGDDHRAAECLERLAIVAGGRGHAATAARLFGAAEATREALGTTLPPADRDEHERSVAVVRAALGAQGFAAAREEGRALPLEVAIEDARQTFAQSPDPPTKERGILSARELEVLRLVAEGLTDPRIAERLHLSTRTVSSHLRSVYRKLGVGSRAGAVKRAYELGLI